MTTQLSSLPHGTRQGDAMTVQEAYSRLLPFLRSDLPYHQRVLDILRDLEESAFMAGEEAGHEQGDKG